MLFDSSKAFDPQLDDLEYIDMSGANILKSVNSSKGLETSMDYKTSTPNSSKYLPRIERQGEDWSNSLLQDLAPSLPNSPPESPKDFLAHKLTEKESEEDTYVTIHGSVTYLDPLCTSCLDTSETNNKDRTYQSITTLPTTPVSVSPPALPSRRNSCHAKPTVQIISEPRTRSKSDACPCLIAQRKKLTQFRPRPDDVLSAVGTRHYTVQEVFDSVAKLTSTIPEEVFEASFEERPSLKRHSNTSMTKYSSAKRLCKRQSFTQTHAALSSESHMGSVNGSPYHMDTYDTFSACRLSQESVNSEAHISMPAHGVKLPLTPKKDNNRRSFLEHINSLSGVKLCRSKSRRSTFTEQSFCGSSKGIRPSTKSPFNRKSFLRTSFRGFKRDKVADMNNNGQFPIQPRFDFGVYPGCRKETHF